MPRIGLPGQAEHALAEDVLVDLGGAALDNEECYAIVKVMRALGLTYIEHQARI